jgi:hypothetical protein
VKSAKSALRNKSRPLLTLQVCFFIFFSALGQAGVAGNFPESESGLLPQAKDLEPEGSSLPLSPKRASVYGIILSFTKPPERSGFIPAVCVCFTSPRLYNDVIGRIVKSAKSSLRNKSRPLLMLQSAIYILFKPWGRREGQGISRRANQGFCRRQKTLSRREVP